MASIFSSFSQDGVDLFDDNTDFPIGSILALPSLVTNNDSYSEWLLCNGISISKTEYSNLYAVIGDTYGSTTTNFSIPDLSDYAIKGCNQDSDLNNNTSFPTTATLSNFKSHSHTISNATSGSGTSNATLTFTWGRTNIVGGKGGVNQYAITSGNYAWGVQVSANSHQHTSIPNRTSTYQGSSSSFAIKPQNILMAYYIKS